MNDTMTTETLDHLFETARDSISVRRVFGDPIVRDGLTLIPAARVAGGGGGGGGSDTGDRKGIGGGFGAASRPAGMYVVRGDEVSWKPATDRNFVAVLVTFILAMCLSTVRMLIKRWPKH